MDRLNFQHVLQSVAPYSYVLFPLRKEGEQFIILDRNFTELGTSSTEESAKSLVELLNKTIGTVG